MKISLFHPFTAKAIGFDENHLLDSHSISQIKALNKIQQERQGWKICVEYFTNKSKTYSHFNLVKKKFYPITNKNNYGKWRSEISLLHFFTNIFSSPDITIINTSAQGGNYVFRLTKLLKFKNKKYFTMLGGIHLDLTPKLKDYYKNAHLIIVHTAKQKNELLKNHFFKNKKIEVLPLGVDNSIFKKKQTLANNSNKKQLLFVGRVSRLKQIEVVIKTIDTLKNNNINCILNIIGPVSDELYYVELKQLVDDLGLNNNVNFIKNIKQEKLVPFYQNADILLLPSKHESFGMVITEAFACRTPVIALKGSGGPEEIIIDGFDGYIVDIKDYSIVVLKLLSNQSLLEKMSNNALTSVEKKWSQNITANILLNLIEESI